MGTFRTKLDFSNNRQVKQRIETTTVLSGGTSFGVTYSQLPSGPNYALSSVTQTLITTSASTGTFSGNNTTTVYSWPISVLYLADSTLSAITPSNSAITQTSDYVLTADTSSLFTVDGNNGYGSYTGVGFTMFATYFVGLGGGNYSGTVQYTNVQLIEAPGLDYSGRTIWNDTSGITRTERLIITDNPQVGYVWTCIDSEGMGEWQPSSGSSSGSTSTIWTAGTGANSAVLGGSGGIASGSTSVSEGTNTIAGGIASHAEGMNTIASGNYSHAEGLGDSSGYPTASGLATHAEGYATTASGDYSHAQGNKTVASGTSSHAGGEYSEAHSNYGFIHSYFSNIFLNSDSSAILGGYLNTIDKSEKSGIFVGSNNTISGGTSGNLSNSIIIGGSANTITTNIDMLTIPTNSGIFAGANNKIIPRFGSGSNVVSGSYCVIAGGESNTISGHSHSFIGGGFNNLIECDAAYNAIVAGQNNINHAYNGVIIGGQNNTLGFSTSCPSQAENSIILGGSFNKIGESSNDTFNTAIIGGTSNLIDNTVNNITNTVILGGSNITATTSDYVYVPNMIINTGGTTSKLAVNTSTPEYTIDARGTGNRLFYNNTGIGSVTLSATTGLPIIGVVVGTANTANQISSISMGARGWNDNIYTVYGYKGDAFIYAGIYTNGLNIISNDGTASSGADYIRFYAGQSGGAGATNNPDLHIQGSGSSRGFVAINVPYNQDPTERLDVNGNGRFRSIGSSASAGALHYTSDGTLTTNTSDERLKTNIVTLTNALEKVKQLRGIKYNWTEEPNGDVRIGFIAQEVNSVVPELTFTNRNTSENYMGVHYDNITALLVEAVKELSSGITTSNNTHLETQTILAEDNNVELNFNGTQQTAIGGGLSILHAKGQDQSADLITDADGNFVTNNDLKPQALTIPFYTPNSSNDVAGNEGNITRDDNYLYVKTSSGWKRTNLESF